MKYFEIGQIVNTQGLKGEVKVNPFTDDIKRFDKLKKIYVQTNSDKKLLEIQTVRYNKNIVIIKFKGLDRIEHVEQYKGKYIFIDENDKLDLPEDTYFISDLIGITVINNSNNQELGKITRILREGERVANPQIRTVFNLLCFPYK